MKLELTKDELKYIELASLFASWDNWFTKTIWFKITDNLLNIYINNISEYYDQNMEIENWISWELEFAIDASLLSKIVSKSKWNVTFQEKWEEIIIMSWWTKFALKKLHFKDLPLKWEWKSEEWVNIDQHWFMRWLEMQFATPKKHIRYQYTWVSVMMSDWLIEFAWTNELKMASYKHRQENSVINNIIIPYEFVSKLRTILSSNKYSVKILSDHNKIFVYIISDKSKILLSSLLINLSFPVYQWLFTQDRWQSIEVKCDDILEAKDNISILAQQSDYNNVYIEWDKMRFEYVSDSWNIDSTIDIKWNWVSWSFTLSYDFYQVVLFIKKLWINDIKISRVWRFIFFNLDWDYNFLASAMDIKNI